MARKATDIVEDEKRRIEKTQKGKIAEPYYNAGLASYLCNPQEFCGNNKSEWIKHLAEAGARILLEIETIQAIKGDGIIK